MSKVTFVSSDSPDFYGQQVTPVDRISFELTLRLLTTSKHLLVHSLEHALSAAPDESDVLQTVINLQAALELLGKLYLVRREGWKSIVDAQFHSLTEAEVLHAITCGSIKTIPYWKVRSRASQNLYLNEIDQELLDSFQTRRNQLMHLGLVDPPKDILNEAIWFLVRVVNQFDWKEFLPSQQQYLSNSLKHVIGPKLYAKLIHETSYVGEAVDRAYELHPSSTTSCIECSNEALVVTKSDDYLCFVCGFEAPVGAMGLIDCPSCNSKRTLAYDLLNVDCNNTVNGRCARCEATTDVSRCNVCATDHPIDVGCALCS